MLTVHHLGISQSERIVWLCEELELEYESLRLPDAGQVLIGCHEPGHYIGGMKITVNVA